MVFDYSIGNGFLKYYRTVWISADTVGVDTGYDLSVNWLKEERNIYVKVYETFPK